MVSDRAGAPGNQYETFAERYDRHSAASPYNTLVERPAVLAVCGALAGRRVLEAGCAGGLLTRELVTRGAHVVAFDTSPTLVGLARERVAGAEFHVHDLREPLAFAADRSFDVVVASLMLHYLRDWAAPLGELRRVLAPGGIVVVSTGHPMAELRLSPSGDYYAIEEVHEEWEATDGGAPLSVRWFRRPLSDALDSAHQAGLVLRGLLEPRPDEEHRAAFGKRFDALTTQPWYLLLTFGRREDVPG
ncbi:class I SAM-dependent methyltransferase [Streptomyces sp. NPDC058000]|uniref:class I SAM-dependent methyltransferase n=1 Tax=Streptomyces sp. NPDC058000 TaxID=3346299 RepID=UPI0036EE63BE